jgi:hypothetical protein
VLTETGHPASSWTVAQELHRLHYSLQANAKASKGSQHPDRDAQFNYINDEVRRFLAAGDPVISIDTTKKELVGADPGYKNGGWEWHPKGSPEKVGTHVRASSPRDPPPAGAAAHRDSEEVMRRTLPTSPHQP